MPSGVALHTMSQPVGSAARVARAYPRSQQLDQQCGPRLFGVVDDQFADACLK